MQLMDKVKINEKSVLETFQEEIPSIYYSDKTEKEYKKYKESFEYKYRHLFKFPPEMFQDKNLIDFGAGTGESTVFYANWGAKCTLVEMNDLAQKISKDIFKKYTKNFNQHKFIHSSIFDYKNPETHESYDIVHSVGVLSHTADKKGAFSKISKFLKPGGYLIFGDPNKAGGFQNMLQRFIIYSFASTPDEMVNISEQLFKNDIDRAQKYGNRSRRCIIFDRWVVQCQDDPSIKEVLEWFEENDLQFYSCYPPFVQPFMSDSAFHSPKFSIESFKDMGVLTEALWMIHNKDDDYEIPKMLKSLKDLSPSQSALVEYVANSNKNTVVKSDVMKTNISKYVKDLEKIDITSYPVNRIKLFLNEVRDLMAHIEKKDLENVKKFVHQAKHLFHGAVGVRHVDFIGHKKY
jgi:2-polyprenyl-3-methyl-5-hydroxy-6-metoxy-1,4-benzoquinol methylase